MNHASGQRRPCRSLIVGRCATGSLLLALVLSAGCKTPRAQVTQLLRAPTYVTETAIDDSYRVGCTDILEVDVDGFPQCRGHYVIDAEGRIELPMLHSPRVEGETSATLANRLAQSLHIPVEHVHCRVIGCRSRAIYLHGPVSGADQSVPYCGRENVVNFIRRCGGLTAGANANDIHVVRGNVALGARPQVFTVDLEAILLNGDMRTNVQLEPFDEVYIGELRRSKVGRALPRWAQPLFLGFSNERSQEHRQPEIEPVSRETQVRLYSRP